MQMDDRGIAITTRRADAALALTRATRAFNHWRTDFSELVDRAIALDPEMPMAHALKGLALATGRNRRFAPVIAEALEGARAVREGASARERKYVDALAAMAQGRLDVAVTCYESILAENPTDLLAQRLLQQELFWMGEAGWMADVVERTAPAWGPETPDYGAFLAVRAFSLEEAGERERAERHGREAVEIDASDAWGAHAVAHVLLMDGRFDEGIAWLEGLCHNWAGRNQIAHHDWWHLCLFLLERGAHQRVLELLDHEVRNPDSPLVQAMPDAYIDIQNVASLLLRLELRGIDVGARWQRVADVAALRIGNHASPFTDAHAAMILAAVGDAERALELLRSMEAFAQAEPGPLGVRYRAAAIPAARAAIAHRAGDLDGTVAALLPARRSLWQMGGSHAQRDVFVQLLADACMRTGRLSELALLLREVAGTGFERVSERTLYAEASARAR
jgi:tetratricopeptide (TPR) repeat protein